LNTAASLSGANGTGNFASGGTSTVNTPNQCAVWTVQNSGTLNVSGNGSIGNAFMNSGSLVVGGTLTGFAEAGGFYKPADAPSSVRQGGPGAITVNAGGQLGTALIGPDSSLTARGANNNRARIGAIQTEGTVTLDNALIDPALATYLVQASLAQEGGTVTINNSEIRGDNGALGGLLMLAPRAQANTTMTMAVTNSQVTNVGNVAAITISELGSGFVDFDMTLTNTTATSSGNAIFLRQRAPVAGNAGRGAITLNINGGTYSGSNAINVDGMSTQPLLITISNGARMLAPTLGQFDGGTALRLAGASTVNATDSFIQGADHGLKLVSGPRAQGGATVTLVNTQVAGANGSAIAITRANTDALRRNAITIGAGTTLSGGDGNILTIDNGALADFTVDGSAGGRNGTVNLSGGIQATGTGTGLNVALNANAAIAGNVNAAAGSTVTLTAETASSRLNGAVTADAATVGVNLSNGGKITGGVSLGNQSTGQIALDGNGSALSNGDGAAVSVDGSTATIALNNGATLAGKDKLLVDVRNTGQAEVTLDNTVQTGDMMRAADSALNVTLQHDTRYTGNVNADTMTVSSGSTWLLDKPQATAIGGLTLNSGIVDFNAGNGPFKTFSTPTLDGTGGRFNMGVDFNPGAGNDLLQIAGKVESDNRLHIDARDQSVSDPRNHITMVEAGGGDGQFALVEGEQVDAGIYIYSLERTGDSWELVQTGTKPGPDPDPDPDPKPDPDPTPQPDPAPRPVPDAKHLSPAAKTALNVASALPFEFYGEMDTLRKRQGDLRLNKTDNGAWVRSFSNFNEIGQAAAPGYSLNQYGGAFGADKRFELPSGDLYVGGFGSYSYNTVGVDGGSSARTNSYGLGGCATWLRSDGWYMDSILKADSFESDLRVVGSNGTPARGHYNTPGYGGSVEVGKHIDIGKKRFVEPYGEVQGFVAHSANDELDSGFRIHNGATRSTQGEIGILGGTNFDLGKGYEVQPYLKTAVVREFVNDNSVTLNGTRIKDDISGNHVLVGAGVVVQLKQNLQAHIDVDYTAGGPIKHTTDVNLGVRYVF